MLIGSAPACNLAPPGWPPLAGLPRQSGEDWRAASHGLKAQIRGAGSSCNIRDIIQNCRRYLKGQEMKEMAPFYAGFTGTIVPSKEEGKYEVSGVIEKVGEAEAVISELPVKKWTQDYREFLEENLPKGEKKKDGSKLLEDFVENHTEKNVQLELSLSPEGAKLLNKPDSMRTAFKLRSSISLNNMVLFDVEGKIHIYKTAVDILKDSGSRNYTYKYE